MSHTDKEQFSRPINPDPPEPRWQAVITVCAVALLYLALPSNVAVGPRWLEPSGVVVLVGVTQLAHFFGRRRINHVLGTITNCVMTLFMIWSLVLLVVALPRQKESGDLLLRSALSLWVSNVLIFALWYWRLDAGGPNGRDETAGHHVGAFLFPQMTEEGRRAASTKPNDPQWSPQFIDYLFLAFNTSTAFSPTDSPVLSRWAKVLTMTQSSISLAVIALLAGRAVNIIGPS
jgi:hypothetical protein